MVGCIDGSHVPIKKPSTVDYEEYRCRKGFFSINVQAVCSPNLKFTNIVSRWKGATHDARMWNSSHLFSRFETGEISGYLLGDNGYPCSSFLLTPFISPSSEPEQRYNRAHIMTRNTIERTFGVWKQRFSCLRSTLRCRPSRCCKIIIATSILDNFTIDQSEPIPQVEPMSQEENTPNSLDVTDSITRQQIVYTHFVQ